MRVDKIKHLDRLRWATGKRIDGVYEVWGMFPDEQSAQWSADDLSCDYVRIESLESAYIWEVPCK